MKKNKDKKNKIVAASEEITDEKLEEFFEGSKLRLVLASCLVVVVLLSIVFSNYVLSNKLPLPEVTGGERGNLGIDKNINEETIDNYLGREDSVYRDMRMLVDPGNYGAIGGDSYLSGFVKGFEVVPLPYIIPVKGLPEEVGDTYTGKTLFNLNEDNTYSANYEESLKILEYYFPKDKKIFLMCGGGGYAGMMKKFLVSLGWNENNIYNTGGYWFYSGKNNVEVKRKIDDEVTYDFWKVTYHDIDFDSLHEVS